MERTKWSRILAQGAPCAAKYVGLINANAPCVRKSTFQWKLASSNTRIFNESSGRVIGSPLYAFSFVMRKKFEDTKKHRRTASYTRISLQSYGTYLLKLNIGSESYCKHGWKFFYFPSLPHACSLLPHNTVRFHFGTQKGERFYFYQNMRTFFRVNNAPYSVVKGSSIVGDKAASTWCWPLFSI